MSMRGCYAMAVRFSLINIYFIFVSTVTLYSSNSTVDGENLIFRV